MMYHFSGYWRTWSRVLGIKDGDIIELNLNPIPCSTRTWANDVAPIIIRRHCTASGRADRWTPELPGEVREAMVEHLGEDQTRSLLEANYMDLIDWDKHRTASHGGGGAALADCRKVTACAFHPDREATWCALCEACYESMLDALA
jgi:hypothetical protein